MKIAIPILILIGLGLIIFNATKLDFSNIFADDSRTALISILATACAIVLLLILRTSRSIAKKKK